MPGRRNTVLEEFLSKAAYNERSGALYREIYLLISDHLGTPRMIAERTGKLEGIKRSDYLPYGESANALGERAQSQGYAGESVRQGFTGYEEDSETGLDFAQARYYASGQGRFVSVDPLIASGTPGAPKTWNRYTYALNNPFRYNDPTGLSSKGTSGILELPQPAQPRSDSQTQDGKVTQSPPPPQDPTTNQDRKGEVIVDINRSKCGANDPALTINGNAIQPTANGGASIKVDAPAAQFFSLVLSGLNPPLTIKPVIRKGKPQMFKQHMWVFLSQYQISYRTA